jgi:prolyl oligopeptidase
MNRVQQLAWLVALAVANSFCNLEITMADPPVAPVRVVSEEHHGKTVSDPYRYMEDFQNPEVQAWVKGQAEFAESKLQSLPGREELLKRIGELDGGAPYHLFGIVRRPNGDLFYFKQLVSENVAKVVFRKASGEEQVLIDPEKLPKKDDEGHVSVSFFRVSPDGSKMLYGFAEAGSEQTTLKVLDIAAGSDLPETIDRLESDYMVPHWLPDGKAFVYSRRRLLPPDGPAADGYKFTQAFLHVLGKKVEDDQLVFADGVKGSPAMAEMDFPSVVITPDSTWAIGQVKHGDETDISLYTMPVAYLGSSDAKWTKVCGRSDLVTEFAVHKDDIYLVTASGAPRFKVLRAPLGKPETATATTVVPSGDYVVDYVAAAQDALYVGILDGVPQRILRVPYGESAKAEPIALPEGETSGSIASVRPNMPGVFIGTRSWIGAGAIYHWDPKTRKLVDTKLLPQGKFDHPEGLKSVEVMVPSHDGVKVPLSIICQKDVKLDGSNPTVLSGYGAYGATSSVRFDPTDLAWLERGGVLAIAHVRGGGAFGKEWHHAGRKTTKPNTWKDFIACAEYLVKQRYTSPSKLAGEGGSAGGILIGRAITERPDLFAAAQIAVGCTDMMRFESTMNGPPNVPEFGTITKKDEFEGLLAMSTLHHIKDGEKYPGIILTHGINDPRVEPWESAKATARFQAASKSGKPVLFRVDYHAGHGIGSTKRQRQEEMADVWSFFLWQFGDPEFQPK